MYSNRQQDTAPCMKRLMNDNLKGKSIRIGTSLIIPPTQTIDGPMVCGLFVATTKRAFLHRKSYGKCSVEQNLKQIGGMCGGNTIMPSLPLHPLSTKTYFSVILD